MFDMKGWKPASAYNGKCGCMCGCKGDYNEDPTSAAFKRRVSKVMNFVGPVRPDAANNGDKSSYSTDAFGGRRYMYVQEGNRNTAVYFVRET